MPAAASAFVIVGTPGDRRVALFTEALAGLGLPPPQLVTWAGIIAGTERLDDRVPPGAVVRIESPGKDADVQRAFIAAGAERADAFGAQPPHDHGRLQALRSWYRGFCRTLERITAQLGRCPSHMLMSDPDDIAIMFDKPTCHGRLQAADVPVPRTLGAPRSYAELVAAMHTARCWRVFVKLAHGSSASGVVAYQVRGAQQLATTTVELVREGAEHRLYNSRRIRVYRDPAELRILFDALCREGVHVEQWLPKAGICERTFDLRVVVIDGRARHVVARLSRSPMTNLHLLNTRGDVAVIRARMGAAAWEAALETCERAAATVPASLHVGVDLRIAPDFRRHHVLELNAFGDLLPGLLDRGQDTYTAEIAALLARPTPLAQAAGAP